MSSSLILSLPLTHGMTSLLPPVSPPCTTVCSPASELLACAPRTVRPSLSITGRPPARCPTSTLSACNLTPSLHEHPLNHYRTPISCLACHNRTLSIASARCQRARSVGLRSGRQPLPLLLACCNCPSASGDILSYHVALFCAQPCYTPTTHLVTLI
jgi:hypothetical protein